MGSYVNVIDPLISKYLPVLQREVYEPAMGSLKARYGDAVLRIRKAAETEEQDEIITSAEEIVEIQRVQRALDRRMRDLAERGRG